MNALQLSKPYIPNNNRELSATPRVTLTLEFVLGNLPRASITL